MSDHRFEKQVGQKLDDLKLTPSAESWENIERELRKDKHRPAPVFWLPLLLLGLGAVGYFLFNTDSNKNSEKIIAGNENKTAYNNTRDQDLDTQEYEKEGSVGKVKVEEVKNFEKTELPVSEKTKAQQFARRRKQPGHIVAEANEKTIARPDVNKNRNISNPPSSPAPLGALQPTGDREPANTEETPENKTVEPVSGEDHGIPSLAKGVKDAENPAPEQKQNKKKTKRWSVGINASGGISSLSEGKLGFSNSQVALVPQNRQPLLLFNVSPAVVPPPTASPSKIYPGLSFSFGLTGKYELSKRFSLSASVNYLQINTISKVGYKIQQMTNALEDEMSQPVQPLYLPPAGEQPRNYDNKYHFIEVPLTLHTRINKSEKLPLYWNAGIAVSKLIKSNSLHYDAVEHLYYSNDNLLKKTQTAVSTGFSFVVFNKTSRPLWIGPAVRYNISQALKKEVPSSDKHFMGVGLDVKWFLK